MAASSLEQLKQEIMREMKAAMEEAKDRMFDDLQYEVARYYIGNPKVYKRTYRLLTTPRANPVTSGEYDVDTMLYLFTGGGYSTGSKPSMEDVLKLANYDKKFKTKNGYARSTIGKKGFWEFALKRMEGSFKSAFSSHF